MGRTLANTAAEVAILMWYQHCASWSPPWPDSQDVQPRYRRSSLDRQAGLGRIPTRSQPTLHHNLPLHHSSTPRGLPTIAPRWKGFITEARPVSADSCHRKQRHRYGSHFSSRFVLAHSTARSLRFCDPKIFVGDLFPPLKSMA